MKVFRFMSLKEFMLLKEGKTLYNKTNHKKDYNQGTTSIGFCFLNLEDFEPELAYHFLRGVDMNYKEPYQVCVVFETDEDFLVKGKGRYAKPLTDKEMLRMSIEEFFDFRKNSMIIDEYSTMSYNREDFKILKYSPVNVLMRDTDWKWREYNEDN